MYGITFKDGAAQFDSNLPAPIIGADEVLIKTAYAGVNRADLFQMQGSYPPPEGASPLPGLEVSGVVVESGRRVSAFASGQEVCALLEGGGYAEYVSVPASQVLAVPAGYTLQEAAALPEALFTVWLALFHTANLTAGECVLIHGGASGIGMMATQMAVAAGAEVITTCGTAEKCAFSRKQGAMQSICYREADFKEVLKTANRSVDVVIDMVGGDYVPKNLSVLSRGGRMVSLAFLESAKISINMAPLLLKQISWHGLTLRSRSHAEKAILAEEIRQFCWDWLESAAVKPVIHAEFVLKDANKALAILEQNLNSGKIVLKA